jgi:hypothetical protein
LRKVSRAFPASSVSPGLPDASGNVSRFLHCQQAGANGRLFELAVAGANFAERRRRAAAGQPGRGEYQQVEPTGDLRQRRHRSKAVAETAAAVALADSSEIELDRVDRDHPSGRRDADASADGQHRFATFAGDLEAAGDAAAKQSRQLALTALARRLLALQVFGREQATVEKECSRRSAAGDGLVERGGHFRISRPAAIA